MSSVSKARKIVEQVSLPELDTLYISNFLVNSAARQFVLDFDSRVIPFSYVEMIFKSLKKSKAVNDNAILKSFFFSNDADINTFCYIYFLTYKQITSAVIEDKKYGLALVLRKKQAPQQLSLFIREAPQLDSAIEILNEQIYSFCNQEEKFTKKAYVQYLLGNQDFETAESDQPSPENASINDLVGKEVEVPKTKGKKIYRLYIPTLPLPTKYPKSTSRIHSSYFAKKFTTPTQAVDIISGYEIVQVKYNEDFIELRTQPEPKKQEKKLNWSDFF